MRFILSESSFVKDPGLDGFLSGYRNYLEKHDVRFHMSCYGCVSLSSASELVYPRRSLGRGQSVGLRLSTRENSTAHFSSFG